MHIYICYKYLATPYQFETSRINTPHHFEAISVSSSADTGNTTLCCRKPQSACPDGAAAGTATSPMEAFGHHLLLTHGEQTAAFTSESPIGRACPCPEATV